MTTELVKIDPNNQIESDRQLLKAGSIIKQGGLVAFPTETVYGLGGDALNAESSSKIYAAKGRPSDNPLIVHIADMDALDAIVSSIPESAVKLAKAFWPGPLTLVFPKSDIVPHTTTGGLDTVAVRMPSDATALSLIRYSGGYIAAPSANASGRPSPTAAQHVMEDLDGRIDMVVDGGSCSIGLESTIVDLTGDIPMILRPGFISKEMLESVVGAVTIDPAISGPMDSSVHPKAPGMKYRHYAPKGSLAIVSGNADNVSDYIRSRISEDLRSGRRCGVIACSDRIDKYSAADFLGNVGNADDEISISSHIYDFLRQCDEQNIECIYSEEFDTPQLGMAIMNRLMKAAGHTIIRV